MDPIPTPHMLAAHSLPAAVLRRLAAQQELQVQEEAQKQERQQHMVRWTGRQAAQQGGARDKTGMLVTLAGVPPLMALMVQDSCAGL